MPTEPQSQPLVSIIVPVYNAADHIARCIESIRRQTYRNLEIILLNCIENGSSAVHEVVPFELIEDESVAALPNH